MVFKMMVELMFLSLETKRQFRHEVRYRKKRVLVAIDCMVSQNVGPVYSTSAKILPRSRQIQTCAPSYLARTSPTRSSSGVAGAI